MPSQPAQSRVAGYAIAFYAGLVNLRKWLPGDDAALYEICLRTAASGDDGTALYGAHPEVVGDLYAVPYPAFDPDLTFVTTDDAGVCGYVLGTADTSAFEKFLADEWFPAMRRKYREDASGYSAAARRLVSRFHNGPELTPPELLQDYPAHLHIDLLPRCQGSGNGRRLMEHFLAALRSRGCPGVHLGLGIRNGRAFGFYLRLGFTELWRDDASIVMGLRLD